MQDKQFADEVDTMADFFQKLNEKSSEMTPQNAGANGRFLNS